MLPFVDIHVHLLAGLDDGPRTMEEAIEMCEIAVADGTNTATALAHQGEGWPDVTPDRIRAAAAELVEKLEALSIPLRILPSAEIMMTYEFEQEFEKGRYLTLGDNNRYMLIELPMNVPIDLRPVAEFLSLRSITPIIAHAERYPEFLFDEFILEELVGLGCLIQVNAASITMPFDRESEKIIRGWFQRNLAHFVASDGHSPTRRPPKIREAYDKIARWTSEGTADRVCCINGNMVAANLPWKPVPVVPKPQPSWFTKLFS